MADYWPNLYDDPYAVKRIEKSVKLAKIEPGMSVLDVGCHKGELLTFIPFQVRYFGLDQLKGDNIDGGFKLEKQFDRIFCLEVLEHLQLPIKTLNSIASHLKPDGLAVISLPNEATIFHRFRSLFGTVDAECFSSCGKHLHLPSLNQTRNFIQKHFEIQNESYYISPGASHSKQAWLGKWLKILPDSIWQLLADVWPSLFSRGFIFKLRKKL